MIIPINSKPGEKPVHKNKPVCRKCKVPLTNRIKRGLLIKTFLFWLPFKRYVCYRCKRKRHVLYS